MSDNVEDQSQSRSTQLLEIYALEIQMYNSMRNYKKLKVGLSPPLPLWICCRNGVYSEGKKERKMVTDDMFTFRRYIIQRIKR